MSEPIQLMLEKICLQVFKNRSLVYFITDNQGKILQWGGDPSGLNIIGPEKEDFISDRVLFMEGILPLEEPSMEFSCIQLSSDICVDALLFKMDEVGYGLIVWDATRKEQALAQIQQRQNEFSLSIEEQKKQMLSLADPGKNEKSRTSLEELFQALDFAVMEMNRQGHFVLIGTPPLWIKHIPQSEQMLLGLAYEEDVFSFLGNFIQEVKEQWSRKPRGSFKSGLWIEKDSAGQELFLDATAVDIHGRKLLIISNEKQSIIQKGRDLALQSDRLKRSGRKLKNLHDEMELRVQERTKDLEEANLKLANELKERKKLEKERMEVSKQLRQSQKMEAIGTLAGGIAHDFNNILSAIMGFSELSLMAAGDEPRLKSRLEKILHASGRAKDLVRQILAFSHQTEYEKKPIKLISIITEVLSLLRALLPSFIEIETNLKSDAHVLADQTQLHQVIMNLCTNAWHSMKEKGGTLSIELKEIEIKPDAPVIVGSCQLMSGRYLVLTIKDTGCGIRPDVIEKIFDPYFTTKDKDKGTGLGLSVVHGIIANCNGHIAVNSQVGKGSEFKLYFPSFYALNKPEIIQESIPLGNGERILFVDDESLLTELAEQILNQLGYQVVTCNDSIKAYTLFSDAQENFDLVISDMIMPKMTGKTLAEKMIERNPNIPVILCSGYSDDIDPETIRESGITQYLMKPIGMLDLARAVKNALKKNN